MTDLSRVTTAERDGVVVVSPVGEFDISSVDSLRATFLEVVTPETNRLVLDLSGTTFVDSMAIGVMLGASRLVHEHDGWIRVAGPRGNVLSVLRLTGLDKVFDLYDSVEHAVGRGQQTPEFA